LLAPRRVLRQARLAGGHPRTGPGERRARGTGGHALGRDERLVAQRGRPIGWRLAAAARGPVPERGDQEAVGPGLVLLRPALAPAAAVGGLVGGDARVDGLGAA